jgi:hypothetical protein
MSRLKCNLKLAVCIKRNTWHEWLFIYGLHGMVCFTLMHTIKTPYNETVPTQRGLNMSSFRSHICTCCNINVAFDCDPNECKDCQMVPCPSCFTEFDDGYCPECIPTCDGCGMDSLHLVRCKCGAAFCSDVCNLNTTNMLEICAEDPDAIVGDATTERPGWNMSHVPRHKWVFKCGFCDDDVRARIAATTPKHRPHLAPNGDDSGCAPDGIAVVPSTVVLRHPGAQRELGDMFDHVTGKCSMESCNHDAFMSIATPNGCGGCGITTVCFLHTLGGHDCDKRMREKKVKMDTANLESKVHRVLLEICNPYTCVDRRQALQDKITAAILLDTPHPTRITNDNTNKSRAEQLVVLLS